MAVPWTDTPNAAGNILNVPSLAAGASTAAVVVDVTGLWQLDLRAGATFGTVAATAGLQVQIYRIVDSTNTPDTTMMASSFTLAAVASTTASQSVTLQPGKYSILCKNLDTTNALTNVQLTSMIYS